MIKGGASKIPQQTGYGLYEKGESKMTPRFGVKRLEE